MTLVDDGSDNEPAVLNKTDAGYTLFYSSDAKKKGASYEGSSAYMATFDRKFNPIKTEKLLTKPESGVLLYDVIVGGGSAKVLFSENHLTVNNLVVEDILLPRLR